MDGRKDWTPLPCLAERRPQPFVQSDEELWHGRRVVGARNRDFVSAGRWVWPTHNRHEHVVLTAACLAPLESLL